MARAPAAMACTAALAILAVLLQQADAHAVMISPQSRPWLDYLLRHNYNPHAVFAGGVAKVSDGGRLRWPKDKKYSICGDAFGETKWDTPGPVSATYVSGQTITTDIVFAQNHLGRLRVRLCPLHAKKSSQCYELKRPDGQGSYFDLPWTPGWWGVTNGFVPPARTDNLPFRIYKMPPVGKPQGCADWSCDMFKGMYVYSFDWKLPPGFTCKHCKLQMHYLTGSSCWPPCLKKPCYKPVNYQYCGEVGSTYPEEFWGCADVKIAGQGSQSWSQGRNAQVMRRPNARNGGR